MSKCRWCRDTGWMIVPVKPKATGGVERIKCYHLASCIRARRPGRKSINYGRYGNGRKS